MFCNSDLLALCIFQVSLAIIVLCVLFPLFLLQIYVEKSADRVGQIPYFVHRSCAFGTLCNIGTFLIAFSSQTDFSNTKISGILLTGVMLFRLEFCINLSFASYYLLIHLNWVKKINDRSLSFILLVVYRLSISILFCLEIALTGLAISLNKSWPDGVLGCYETILLLLLWFGFCYTQLTMGKISKASHERVRTNRNSISRNNMETEHNQTIRKINQTLLGVFCLLVVPVPILMIRTVHEFQHTAEWRVPRGDYYSAFLDVIRVFGYGFALWYAWLPIRPSSSTLNENTRTESVKPRLELQSLKVLRPSISGPAGGRSRGESEINTFSITQPYPAMPRFIRADSHLGDSVSGKLLEDSILLSPSSPTLLSARATPNSDSPPINRGNESSIQFPSQVRDQYAESISQQTNSPLVSQTRLETVIENKKSEIISEVSKSVVSDGD